MYGADRAGGSGTPRQPAPGTPQQQPGPGATPQQPHPGATPQQPAGPETWDVGDEPGCTEILQIDLDPVVGAASRARALITEGCARWSFPELTGSASLAVTEMVNNVIAHAHTAMSVRLVRRSGGLHLAVRDYSPDLPVFRGVAPPTATGGRGLLLIDAVARRWGTTPLADGKVVWATLLAQDEAAAEPAEGRGLPPATADVSSRRW